MAEIREAMGWPATVLLWTLALVGAGVLLIVGGLLFANWKDGRR